MESWRTLAVERKKLWDRATELSNLPEPTQEQLNEIDTLMGGMRTLEKRINQQVGLGEIGTSMEGRANPGLPAGGGGDGNGMPQTDRAFLAGGGGDDRTLYGTTTGYRSRAIKVIGRDFVENSERRFLQRFRAIDDEGNIDPGGAQKARQYESAFRRYLRNRESVEDRAVMQVGFDSIEARDLGVGTGASGGFVVPPQFLQQLVEAQLAYGGMRQSGTIINTSDQGGADLPVPTDNDTAQTGAILAEAGGVPLQDIGAFAQITLHSYMYTSKMIKVSFQLMQDAFFPIEPYLARKLGIRLGRIQNTHFTTGTGTGQPNGVVTAATLGKTGLTGQTLSIIYDDLVDLMHSVDPAYRTGTNGLPKQQGVGSGVPTPYTAWMLKDLTLAAVQKIKDSQGRPIWAPGLAGFAGPMPDSILGFPYVINQDVATMAANAKSVLFGDFSNYFIRDALDVQVLRLNERFADNLQVAFVAFQRSDGNLINAGTNPIKYYANSAT